MLDDDDENSSREARTFRNWMNSLGCDTYCQDLTEDLRDGYMLCEALDKVKPGVIEWRRVTAPPMKLPFKKMEN